MYTSSPHVTFPPLTSSEVVIQVQSGGKTGVGIQEAWRPAPPSDWLYGPGQFLLSLWALVFLKAGALPALPFLLRDLERAEGLRRELQAPLGVSLGPGE